MKDFAMDDDYFKKKDILTKLTGLSVIYEDNHLLVAVKPHGIPSQGGKANENNFLDILKSGIKKRDDKQGKVFLSLISRLDQPVGGIILLAKTSKAAARLSEQQRSHKIKKYYLAVTSAIPEKNMEVLQNILVKNREKNFVEIISKSDTISNYKDAKEAKLIYRCIRKNVSENMALLEIELITGRSHQIRVQLKEIGCPIWGDYLYNPLWKKRAAGDNPALWAYKLKFMHPIKKEEMEFIIEPATVFPWCGFSEKR